MREIATKKKPLFVQANYNSGQGHVLHYITSFCVVFRLSTLYSWLAGKTETKQVVNTMSKWVEGGGSWKGHKSGQAVFIFLAASPLVRPAGKTAMLRRLTENTYFRYTDLIASWWFFRYGYLYTVMITTFFWGRGGELGNLRGGGRGGEASTPQIPKFR